MRLIAITGPMGSGKSTVAAYIASRGFDVYDCDRIFNTGVINSPDYVAEIERLFGEQYQLTREVIVETRYDSNGSQ